LIVSERCGEPAGEGLARTAWWSGALVIGFILLLLMSPTVLSSEAERTLEEEWVTVLLEDFDHGLGARWIVTDTSTADGGEYTWASTTFTASSPFTATWAVGGGAQGSALHAGVDGYPANVDSWLVYGPLDLRSYVRAEWRFDWWLDAAAGDGFGWCVVTDTVDLAAQCDAPLISGSPRSWMNTALSLDDYAGASDPVYLAFRFASDADAEAGWGAFVDDVELSAVEWKTVYLPLVRRDPPPEWTAVEIQNAGFEADWSEEGSHHCLIIETNGAIEDTVRDNIFTPPGWVTWFLHGMPVEHDPQNQVGWSQPEVRDSRDTDPDRMHSGEKGMLLFTFWRVHDAGFLQQVEVGAGTPVRFAAWAHAWSNNGGPPEDPEDAEWSEGSHVGYAHYFAAEGTPDLDEGDRNFTFWVGIDPTGGTNPFADSVVWGQGAHIYNAYFRVPTVQTTAISDTVTLFLRSRTLWPFKHNDAYWDDALLEALR
jgi:hypothetical protein